MLVRLVFLFVLVALVELAILVYLGIMIGAVNTIVIVVATGILGVVIARSRGLAALSRIRSSLEQGTIPSNDLFRGVLLIVAGLLLLAPGVITDMVGLALLIPQTRRAVAARMVGFIWRRIKTGDIEYWEGR